MIKKMVSTIIPVFNRAGMLQEAVQSVLDQTYRPIEIIIVDDGSTDNTAQVADQFPKSYPDIVKVIHIENGGVGLAREVGRQLAQGEFIQYLDSDDLLLPHKFEIQEKALREHPDCGVAYGQTRLMRYDGSVDNEARKWTGKGLRYLFPNLLIDRWWSTHTPLFRRSVCDVVGSWSDMRMFEDWDYDARVGALETKLVYCPEFLSITRQHHEGRITTNAQAVPASITPDTCRLIEKLYLCAVEAGVSAECAEMEHLSRWAFSMTRQAGACGLCEEASRCFEIALVAAGRKKPFYFQVYGVMAKLIGLNKTGKLFMNLRKIIFRRSGIKTIKQSWMD